MVNTCDHEPRKARYGNRTIRVCRECKRSLEPDMQGRPRLPKVGRARAQRREQMDRARS